jgi:hypothetical protein
MGDRRGSHLNNSESKIFRKRENKAEDRRRKFKREERESLNERKEKGG